MLLILFLAGCNKDEDKPGVPPTVTSTDPDNNATGVELNHLIAITFSEPMNQFTLTSVTLMLNQGATVVPGTITYADLVGTFTPTINLEPNMNYTGTVSTGAKDIVGDAMTVDHTFSFTTGDAPDNILPTVLSTDPLNAAISIVRNKVVSLTFSEMMDPLTITNSTFTLMQGATVVDGAVSYTGITAKFTPTLVLGRHYLYFNNNYRCQRPCRKCS